MPETHIHDGEPVLPLKALENCFHRGMTVIKAAFNHSYFIHPDRVRQKTPMFPDKARQSRKHYPDANRGDCAIWKQKQKVKICDNMPAKDAWEKYTGQKFQKKSGYGVRHIWGEPWNPDAFTAGWNLCYMPFWAGMLTEDQHPYPELKDAIRQAAWDLYFRDNPVCDPPDFVTDPGINLDEKLNRQPLLLLLSKEAKQI